MNELRIAGWSGIRFSVFSVIVIPVLATFSIRKQRRLLGGSHGEGR
jgi:hypothetical protein